MTDRAKFDAAVRASWEAPIAAGHGGKRSNQRGRPRKLDSPALRTLNLPGPMDAAIAAGARERGISFAAEVRRLLEIAMRP